MFAWRSTLPSPFGNTRFSSPFGQGSFHARNVLTTIGASGISRLVGSDFGEPIVFQRIGALPHGQHLALEVDSLPSQSAQLTRALPAEHRGHQQRSQLPGVLEHAADLVLRRNVDADLQRPLVTLRDPCPPAIV